MKIMIMAGGTGGHVYPALAVAQRLQQRGHEVVWMGAPDSFESAKVPAYGIALETIRVSGLRGKGWKRWLSAPGLLWTAVRDALAALKRQAPDVVLGMGGFASGPGALAARLRRIPLVIHEQNAAAGLTNRVLSRLAREVLEAFPGTFGDARTVGNPVRAEVAALPAPEVRLDHSHAPRLLVLGGSQGARALNEIVPAALALLPLEHRPQVVHQAGRTLEVARQAYAAHNVQAHVRAFIDDMPGAYGWADLVVCRAGASTVAELAAAGNAAILVPYPHAVDDHQTRNGEYLTRSGAAVMVQERELTPEWLARKLDELLHDRLRLLNMAEAARQCAWPHAAQTIADACVEHAR